MSEMKLSRLSPASRFFGIGRASRWLALCAFAATLSASVLVTKSASADEVAITEKARRHFKAGVNFTNDPDGAKYADAYREFKLAYAESPSWKILGNLGIAAMKLERDGDAIEAFKIYLKEGGDEIEPSERDQVTRDLETLESSVTWISVDVAPPGATLIDERIPVAGQPTVNHYEVGQETTRIGLHAGRHRITVQLEGYEDAKWSFEAAGGELSKTFELKKIEEKVDQTPVAQDEPKATQVVERPIPLGVWIGAGVTGVFVVGTAVTGILATGKRSKYDEANDGTDPDNAESLKKSGETLNLVTDIMLGGAIVAAGVTAVLYATRPEVTRETASFQITPTALLGGGGVWMHGSF